MTEPIFGTAEYAADAPRRRHPGVQTAMAWLAFSHLPDQLKAAARPFFQSGLELLVRIPNDSAELTTALNTLVEAKDWAVRAAIRSDQGVPGPAPRPATIVDAPRFETAAEILATPRPIQDRPQA